MKSLRFTALLWTTLALGVVGAIATAVSYKSAWREAAEFMDRELRQIALNVGEGAAETPATREHRNSKDEFVVGIWGKSGEILRHSSPAVALPRQPEPGFSTIRFDGKEWRVFRLDEPSRTVQVAQRTAVRRELAEIRSLSGGRAYSHIHSAGMADDLVVFGTSARPIDRPR